MDGLSFSDALDKMRQDQKIVYGTRSKKFHIIDKNDRDFNTSFAYNKADARKAGESGVKSNTTRRTNENAINILKNSYNKRPSLVKKSVFDVLYEKAGIALQGSKKDVAKSLLRTVSASEHNKYLK